MRGNAAGTELEFYDGTTSGASKAEIQEVEAEVNRLKDQITEDETLFTGQDSGDIINANFYALSPVNPTIEADKTYKLTVSDFGQQQFSCLLYTSPSPRD